MIDISMIQPLKKKRCYLILTLVLWWLCFSGASSDFDGATKIAKMMVTRFGMSDKVRDYTSCAYNGGLMIFIEDTNRS